MTEPTSEPRETAAAARAIRFHYDLSDDFFALWLDPERIYSCARFEGGDDLATAQLRKLDHHIAAAGAAGRSRVLDVGCGWGALLRRLVSTAGVTEAVGLTLSENQLRFIRSRPQPGVTAHLEDWRRHRPAEPYGAIISIGAFEHFAHREMSAGERLAAYRRFFEFCHRHLEPGGGLSVQTICYNFRAEPADLFVSERIFPNSELPLAAEVLTAADGLFELRRLRNDPQDYQRTCRLWRGALKRQRRRAVELVGEERTADYERYLETAAAAVRTRVLGLLRISWRRLPAGGGVIPGGARTASGP